MAMTVNLNNAQFRQFVQFAEPPAQRKVTDPIWAR